MKVKRWAWWAQTSVQGYVVSVTSRPASGSSKSPSKTGPWSEGLAQLELMDYQFRHKDQQVVLAPNADAHKHHTMKATSIKAED